MSKKFVLMGGLGVIMAFASCTTHYQLTTIDRSRILIDQRYDVRQDTKAVALPCSLQASGR